MDGPGGIKKTTDEHELHLGIPWPSLLCFVHGINKRDVGAVLLATVNAYGETATFALE